MQFAYHLPLLAPLLLFIAMALSLSIKSVQPHRLARLAEVSALLAMIVAFVSAALLVWNGPQTSSLIGAAGIGLSVRLDMVSASMFCVVAFIGWIVLRYSVAYLHGETRQGYFVGWICATLASVMMLVLSGNLFQLVVFWILTSLCLHKLLRFYRDRRAARRAARKKFLIARAGDLAIVGAAILLFNNFGSTDIATILEAAGTAGANTISFIAVALIALAALLKSAQFPTHGWLTEVMETPTPVSALLHAGVINAGGFLLIRFADVMLLSPGVLAVLVMIGGFTAIFGGAVMLTQSAVKTSLAWSTVSQMGFMIMQCGLALFPLALLHIVAHSLYKAHAFLASGSAVELVAANRRPGAIAIPDGRAVLKAFSSALAIYVLVGFGFGLEGKSPQAIALGAILIFGVAYLIAQGLADDAPRALTLRTSLYSLAASISYFALQSGAEYLATGSLPMTPVPGPLEWALITLALISFALVAFAQSMFPLWAYHPAVAGLRIHLANGLYINAIFDRLIGGWRTSRTGPRDQQEITS